MELAPADRAAIEKIIAAAGEQPAAAVPILQRVQRHFGYLPLPALREICRLTKISSTQLWGVATFYSQFRLKPLGKNLVKICQGTACHVGGADRLLDTIRAELKLGAGEDTTSDGLFTVEVVACLGCCSLSPVMMINDKAYAKLVPTKVRRILKGYRP